MAQAIKVTQMMCCSLLIVSTFMSICAARPSHIFNDAGQRTNEQETANDLSPEHHYALNNMLDSDALTNLRIQLLAQQLSNMGTNDIDAMMPTKRQAQLRFRQCYFNPISCFRK